MCKHWFDVGSMLRVFS